MSWKDFIAKLFRIEREVTAIPTTDQQLSKAIEKERGRLQGEVLRERKRAEEFEKELESEEKEEEKQSAMRLTQRKKELSNEDLIGGCDWNKLFLMLEKTKKFKIKVVSFDLLAEFGYFDTLITDNKGMMNLFVRENPDKDNPGRKRRVITGSTFSKIFKFPYGIAKMASKGIFIINLNKDGEYVNDPLSTEIPDLVIDKNGKYDLSEVDTEPFIDRYIKVQSELSDAHTHIETLEKTIAEKIRQENLTKHQLNIAKTRAETSESELSANIQKIKEMTSTYSDATNRIVTLSQQLDISKKQTDTYEGIVDKVIDKLDDAKSSTKLDATKDLIEDTMQMLNNLRPESQEIIVEPKKQEEFDKKIEKLEKKGKNI